MEQPMAEFLRIAKKLNDIGTTPLLMGSLGLEYATQQPWDPQDIDIHVHGDPRPWHLPAERSITDWSAIVTLMATLGYELVDLHEHTFQKGSCSVGYGVIETLPDFAQVSLGDLILKEDTGVRFLLPSLRDYLKIYQASAKDSYRANKNNQKDFAKIAYLQDVLGKENKPSSSRKREVGT